MFFLVLSLASLLILYLYKKKKYSYWEKRGIKGPKPIWFFGNTFDEIFGDFNEKEREYLKKYGHHFGTYRGVKPIFNTSRPDDIKQIMNDSNVFYSIGSFEFYDNYFSQSILLRNGKDWINGRKAQTHFFTGNKIKSLFSHFESSIDNFLENVNFIQSKEKTESLDFKKLTAYMSIDVISKLLFSVSINSYKERESNFVKNSIAIITLDNVLSIISGLLPKEVVQFFKINGTNIKEINKVGDMFKKMVDNREKKNETYNDLIALIKEINMKKDLGLTENEIIGNGMIGYFAGVNFLSDSLSSIMYHLIHNPEEKEKLIKEIEKEFSDGISYEKLVDNSLLEAVINESLRLTPNTRVFSRTAMVDTEIDGIKIEKGTEVKAISWLAQNNEEYFPNAQKFDPSRFTDKSSSNPNIINGSTYLPFGDGPKQCIGKRFSLFFMKYFLAKFFLEYDVYKPNDYKKEMFMSREFDTFDSFVIGLKKKQV